MKRLGFATIFEQKPGEKLIEREKKQLELIEKQKQNIIASLDAQIDKLQGDKSKRNAHSDKRCNQCRLSKHSA